VQKGEAMKKGEAGDIARALRVAIKEHDQVDIYHLDGGYFVVPVGGEFVARYNRKAKASHIAQDVYFISKEEKQ